MKKNKKLQVKKKGKEEVWYCPDCDWEQDDWEIEHPTLHKNVNVDKERAKEYCETHMYTYSHDSCKPEWCKTCGYLLKYLVVVGNEK